MFKNFAAFHKKNTKSFFQGLKHFYKQKFCTKKKLPRNYSCFDKYFKNVFQEFYIYKKIPAAKHRIRKV